MGACPFFICATRHAYPSRFVATEYMVDLPALLEKTLSGLGYELVLLERAGRGLMRIYIDKPGGIQIEDCVSVSHQLTQLFTVENIDYDRLEVSSPGVDRPLTRAQDYVRFAGEMVALKLRVPIEKRKRLTGRLVGLEAEMIKLDIDGVAIDLGEMRVTPFTVPHDAREPLQLRCSDGATSLGILTDLGHATAHVLEQLALCNAMLLECNHETAMLAASPYPPFLKKRVGGKYGHLSNEAAADIARAIRHAGLNTVVAAHLSAHNNSPDLARAAMSQALDCSVTEIGIADPTYGTDWIGV